MYTPYYYICPIDTQTSTGPIGSVYHCILCDFLYRRVLMSAALPHGYYTIWLITHVLKTDLHYYYTRIP